MSTIQTHSGKLIDLKNMVSSDVNIQDIIDGVSVIKRFNGRGLTVLQHTLSMFDYVRAMYVVNTEKNYSVPCSYTT